MICNSCSNKDICVVKNNYCEKLKATETNESNEYVKKYNENAILNSSFIATGYIKL
ncbi:MAG: hypothetical protein ACFFDF_00430 [Candidatus Odinarchaeota archaeon]